MILRSGVGDFLAVITLAKKLRSDFVNAPADVKGITDELQNLATVLDDIELYADLESETQKETLPNLLTETYNILKDVVKLRDKYSELEAIFEDDTDNAPATVHSKRRSVQTSWKKMRWNSCEKAISRQRIDSAITTAQALRDTITRILEDIDRRDHVEDLRVRWEILDWLTPINYGPEQSAFLYRKQDGTGQWFLDSPEYRNWIREDRRTLFCPGIPGAGKTILTSIVVDELTEQFRGDKTVGIAYLYCSFRRNHDQKITDLLASLLKQLASQMSSVPSCLAALHAEHNSAKTRPSLQELIDALHTVAGSFSRTFVIVDALDECQTTDDCQSMLISEMFDLQSKCGTNIFATSRFIPDITTQFSSTKSTQLEIRASKKDIEKFLDGSIDGLPSHKHWDDRFEDIIKTSISGVVDGMFLLAHIYLQSFHDKTTTRDLKKVLVSLHKQEPGSSDVQRKTALGLAYDDTMKRINEQEKTSRDLAMTVLLWITFAERPLRAVELQHALAVKTDHLDLDLENMGKIDDMLSVCAGLVTVDAESGIIGLAHYTAQEYLENKQLVLLPDAQYRMAEVCATYLTFVTSTGEQNHSFLDDESRYVLLDYSLQNWEHHVRKSGKPGPRAANLLQDYKTLQRLYTTTRLQSDSPPNFTYRPDFTYDNIQAMATHLASIYGVETAVMHLIHQGVSAVDCRTVVSRDRCLKLAVAVVRAYMCWLLASLDLFYSFRFLYHFFFVCLCLVLESVLATRYHT